MAQKKQQDPTLTIFDFIFSRKPGEKMGRRDLPDSLSMSPDAQALAQLAIGPAKMPVEATFRDIERQLSGLGNIWAFNLGSAEVYTPTVDYGQKGYAGKMKAKGVGFETGPGHLGYFLSNPRGQAKFILNVLYKPTREFARVGGFARGTDKWLYRLWAHNNGLDRKLGWDVGSVLGLQEGGMFAQQNLEKARDTALNMNARWVQEEFGYDISERDFRRIYKKSKIDDAKGVDNQSARISTAVTELTSRGVAGSDATRIAQALWGVAGGKNRGLYTQDMKSQARHAVLRRLKVLADQYKASGNTKMYNRVRTYMNGVEMWGGGADGMGRINSFFLRLGTTVGKAGYLSVWLKQGIIDGDFTMKLIDGRLFEDPFLGVMAEKKASVIDSATGKVAKKDGKDWTVSVLEGSGLPQSVFSGLYYLHPFNVVKGLVWDGRFLLRLGIKDGKINRDSLAFMIYQAMPAQSLSRAFNWAMDMPIKGRQFGPRAGINKIWDLLTKTPLLGSIIKIAQKVLSKVVAIPIIGDIILTFVVQYMLEFVALFLLIILSVPILLALNFMVGPPSEEDFAMQYLNPPVTQVGGAEPGTGPPQYGGAYSGSYSGTANQIFESVAAEMGVTSSLGLVDCDGADAGGKYCNAIDGGWCYSYGSLIVCKDDEINSSSDEYITRLFRHELTHSIQARDHYSTWGERWGTQERVNCTEWGAEHVSGNGGAYCFTTMDGQFISGMEISSQLLARGCDGGLLGQAAYGDLNAFYALEATCGVSPRTYIIGRQIGGNCK